MASIAHDQPAREALSPSWTRVHPRYLSRSPATWTRAPTRLHQSSHSASEATSARGATPTCRTCSGRTALLRANPYPPRWNHRLAGVFSQREPYCRYQSTRRTRCCQERSIRVSTEFQEEEKTKLEQSLDEQTRQYTLTLLELELQAQDNGFPYLFRRRESSFCQGIPREARAGTTNSE